MRFKVSLKKRIGLLVVVIALMISTMIIPAQAWTLCGWKLDGKLVFFPHKGFGSTTISHFNEAFWEWNKECSVYNLQRALSTHDLTNFYDGKAHGNKIFRVANPSDPSPARARTFYNTQTMKVNSADININVSFPYSNGAISSSYDVWTVFIHEAGHVLGFDHSSLSNSVMDVTPMGTIRRYLAPSDIDGINYLYK